MDENRKQLLELMNQSISAEYGALFLLPQHIAQVKDEELKRQLRGIMEMELEHAEKTARIIFQLGGQPVADIPNLKPRKALKEILDVHLEGERQAIALYSKALSITDDPQVRSILEEIRAEEEDHQRTIQAALEKYEAGQRQEVGE